MLDKDQNNLEEMVWGVGRLWKSVELWLWVDKIRSGFGELWGSGRMETLRDFPGGDRIRGW